METEFEVARAAGRRGMRSCSRQPSRQRAAGALSVVSLLALLAGAPAHAKLCGDDVEGRDVPCDCGDTVVSNLSLADDPITLKRCKRHGLIVRAPQAKRGLSLELNGETLRGEGAGIGIWIVHGGPGGARVRSSGQPAVIEGFDHGIAASDAESLDRLENVVVRDSKRDGVRVGANGYRLDSIEVRGSGRDGFSLGGHGYRVTNTRAVDSRRFGYSLMGQTGSIGRPGEGNTAESSGDTGFKVMGSGHRIVDCRSVGSRKDGISLHGSGHEIDGCSALANERDGIVGMGSGFRIVRNEARDNTHSGLRLRGPGVTDDGGNRGAGNGGPEGQTTAAQCVINNVVCKP